MSPRPDACRAPADHRARRVLAALVLALVPTVAACGEDEPEGESSADAAVAAGIERTLHQRAAALRSHDEQRFLRTLAHRRGFVAEQATYFDNLTQLPVAGLGYRIDADTITEDGGGYWVQVEVSLRLEAYDAAPVTAQDRFRFTPARDGSRYLLASTTDPDWEARHALRPQPWDLGPIEVRETAGVLGVFDAGSVVHAGTVLDSVAHARYDVASVLGVARPPAVVVYAFSDRRFEAAATGLPVGTPAELDAATLAIPVDADEPEGRVASYRVLLDPEVLAVDRAGLDRLVRHELTHVLLAGRDDAAPLWLTEGIAEYVSVRPMAPSARQLPAGALDLAATATGLPPDEVFAGPDARGWYAVSWWICEYVAATYGDDTLFGLLDELDDGADVDRVLSRVLGLTPTQLAQRGIGLMQRTYSG